MARQREFDEEKVLDALKNIFWEKGSKERLTPTL